LWESASAIAYIESGAELFVLRNPDALEQAREAASRMWPGAD
jgi:hypothetical protein